MCLFQSPSIPDAPPQKVAPMAKSPENANQLAGNDVSRRRGLAGAMQNIATSGMGLGGSKVNTTNPNMSAFSSSTANSFLG